MKKKQKMDTEIIRGPSNPRTGFLSTWYNCFVCWGFRRLLRTRVQEATRQPLHGPHLESRLGISSVIRIFLLDELKRHEQNGKQGEGTSVQSGDLPSSWGSAGGMMGGGHGIALHGPGNTLGRWQMDALLCTISSSHVSLLEHDGLVIFSRRLVRPSIQKVQILVEVGPRMHTRLGNELETRSVADITGNSYF
ncbi:hypothetical protein BGZ63DRAFT_379948 [Mariannaea sp. PMI_226]|nr:hypothetical protein BGZ63DRAFT_379948 [Mariannaea sp. PMI_226]